MTSNRVGGPSPGEPGKHADTSMQEQHRKIEKVEKISETENEGTRKRKFQQFMNEEEATKEDGKTPGPMEAGFYTSSKDSLFSASTATEDFGEGIVPSPPSSPPPNVILGNTEQTENENPPLPHSHDFWTNVDSPSDQPIQGPKYQENQRSTGQTSGGKVQHHGKDAKKKKEELLLGLPTQQEKGSIFGPPGKALDPKKAKEEKQKEEELLHSSKKRQASLSVPGQPLPSESTKKETTKETAPTTQKKGSVFAPQTAFQGIHDAPKKQFKEEGEGSGGQRGNKHAPIEIGSFVSALPDQVVPAATAATMQAAPFLNHQTTDLFFQMVGTIYVMTAPPGVSRTEIVLNSPSFANSKFFGATISIEKYATAPDSLNIRLTGSDEAVKTFNQNIPNLYAAFQNGNFGFRIGRINAEYSTEKPIFRRKEPGEGRKDSGGGGDFTGGRGNK